MSNFPFFVPNIQKFLVCRISGTPFECGRSLTHLLCSLLRFHVDDGGERVLLAHVLLQCSHRQERPAARVTAVAATRAPPAVVRVPFCRVARRRRIEMRGSQVLEQAGAGIELELALVPTATVHVHLASLCGVNQ